MPISLIKTKLHPPVLPTQRVQRIRLTARLDEGILPDKRLVLVSAPAGYGKTTLVVEWLQEKEESGQALGAWVSLDSGDNDPARFFTCIVESLRCVLPDLDPAILDLVELPSLPPVEAILTELINQLEEQFSIHKCPVVLVLDDYFLIQNPLLHQGVGFLIEHLPEGLHLLIGTREDPPLPLARLQSRRQIVEVRLADLRFSVDEAGLFFRQAHDLVLSLEELTLLDRRTEGWIAGLQLAGLVLHDDVARSADAAQTTASVERLVGSVPHYIIDYLVEEVLERQSPDIREFLIRSSILYRLSGELCDAILPSSTGNKLDSASLLNHLAQSNLFLIPLDNERHWYRFHPLFADVLRSNLSAQEETELHRRAMVWLEANGFMEEALEHSVKAGDMDATMRMIVRQADAWMKGGEIYTLLSHLSALPQEKILSNNSLTAYYGVALLFAGKGMEAAHLANTAAPDPGEGLARGRLMTLQAWLANAANEPQMLDLARQAIELVGKADPFFQALALIVIGSDMDWEGEYPAAAKAYLEAYEIGQQINHPFLILGCLSNLAYSLLEQGNFQEGISLCESAKRRFVDGHGRPLPVASMLDGPLSALYFDIGEWEKAREHALITLDRCQRLFSTAILGGNAEIILARLDFMDGHLEKSLELLRRTRQYGEAHHLEFLSLKMAAAESLLHFLNGDLSSARRTFAEIHSPLNLVSGLKNAGERLRGVQRVLAFLQARLLFAEGKAAEARPLLEQIARESSGPRRMEIGVLHALVLAELRDVSAAREKLAEAIALAAPNGCIWPFYAVGRRNWAALLAMLRQARPAAPAFIDRLILALSTAEPEAKPAGNIRAGLPEPLSEQEIKVLGFLAKGFSNQQIAEELVISLGTAKWHVHNVLQKLGASSRSQAIAIAKEKGIL